jgi:hypothetical protein
VSDSKIVYLEGYRVSAEGRVRDVELAEKLGSPLRALRRLIAANTEELNDYGVLPLNGGLAAGSGDHGQGGRPSRGCYWLNREQALLLCTWSQAPKARAIRAEIVRVLTAVLDGLQFKGEVPWIARVLFLEAPADWERMWPDTFVQAVCKLKGQQFTGQQPGGWMGKVYGDIYRLLLGDRVYDTIRELNPNPKRGSNHHQRLREEARARVNEQIEGITALANTSITFAEFMSKMKHVYRGAPLQLGFWAANKSN